MCICVYPYTYTLTHTHLTSITHTEDYSLEHCKQKIRRKKNFDSWEGYIDSVLSDYQLTGMNGTHDIIDILSSL